MTWSAIGSCKAAGFKFLGEEAQLGAELAAKDEDLTINTTMTQGPPLGGFSRLCEDSTR
jgi:hypothetical protein